MVIELDNDVFDTLAKEGACRESDDRYVTARRGNGGPCISLPIPVSTVEDAEGFVVTDNVGGTGGDDPAELGALRCDTLAEAVNAMVHGVEGQEEATFFCELCADYGTVIEGIARWCHPGRHPGKGRWF